MARGVLMERQGLSPVAAIRQLADMAAAAGIPVTEMAAAVLRQELRRSARSCRQEPPSAPADSAPPAVRRPIPPARQRPGAARRGGVA